MEKKEVKANENWINRLLELSSDLHHFIEEQKLKPSTPEEEMLYSKVIYLIGFISSLNHYDKQKRK